jgi:hypothetical protein
MYQWLSTLARSDSTGGVEVNKDIDIKELVGETLTHIDTDENNNEIMLTTASGRIVKILHYQDCCESVRIEDTLGNWHDLIGKVIVYANQESIYSGDPPPKYPDSWTRTNFTFQVDDATVISRWIGESSGYYSEEVSVEELTKRES